MTTTREIQKVVGMHLLVLMIACEGPRRIPSVFEVPSEFRGWVRIEERSDCPPLPRENDKWLYQIPSNGYLCTSTPMDYGWAKDDYFFVNDGRQPIPTTGWGGGGLIWGGSNGHAQVGDNPPRHYQQFFVGTEAQFRSAGPSDDLWVKEPTEP